MRSSLPDQVNFISHSSVSFKENYDAENVFFPLLKVTGPRGYLSKLVVKMANGTVMTTVFV